ncbi:MAG: alpha/beta hydrolase [Caulobacteraceae bacterium]
MVNVFEYEDLSDVILVGHSYGGMVITGVATRIGERIRTLVYLDAFLPATARRCGRFPESRRGCASCRRRRRRRAWSPRCSPRARPTPRSTPCAAASSTPSRC